MRSSKLRVLTYHRVIDPADAGPVHRSAVSASPEVFERQMRHLARHYRVVGAEEVLEGVRTGRRLPRRAVLVTFDDAYADFGEVAWPILRRCGLPATLFVPTAYPGSRGAFWWDRLSRAAHRTRQPSIDVPGAGSLPLSAPEARLASLSRLFRHLKEMPHGDAMELVEQLCTELDGEGGHGTERVLTWEELRELAKEGVSMGPHTRTHPALTRMRAEEARAEIGGSREDLGRELGDAALPIFAYPFGVHDAEVVEWVREAGFELAFTCMEGHNRLTRTDPLRLRRTGLTRRTTPALFRIRLHPWFAHLDRWRRRVKERTARAVPDRVERERPVSPESDGPGAGATPGAGEERSTDRAHGDGEAVTGAASQTRPLRTPTTKAYGGDGSATGGATSPKVRPAGAPAAVRVELHTRLEPLAVDWDDLADRSGGAPWLRPGWILPWWKAFGSGRLEVLALRRGGRLEALVPFGRRGPRLQSPSNYHTPAFDFLAADAHAADRLARELLRRAPRRTSMYFLPEAGIGLEACTRAATDAGYRLVPRVLERMPFVPVEAEWPEYEAQLSSRMLRELRRRRRRLEEQGSLDLTVVDGTEGLDTALEETFRVEAAGWKGRRGTAVGARPSTREFYRTIARWGAERGWLRLAHLRLDGRPLATDFAFEADGVHYLLKTGYDEAYRRYGPGMLLRHEMLRRAFALPLHRYEFLGHDVSWKRAWAPSECIREQYLLQLFRPSPLGSVEYAAFAYGRPVAKRLLERLGRGAE